MTGKLSFIPIGGIGDVTKNMYLYEYSPRGTPRVDAGEAGQDQILIVDCGLGFADETMLGVDLLLPDISYLLKTRKKIVGMVLTHGHEDHIGALPFILPQLPNFPIFASPLTAALANEKLKEFGGSTRVQTIFFDGKELSLGDFKISFIHVTHSVPDSTHLFIKTPIGNFYHGSDFKFEEAPFDRRLTDYQKITKVSSEKVLCLMSDCLGAEREGRTPSEATLLPSFAKEIRNCPGKFIVTTYSSNIARLNQIIKVSQEAGRKVCFIGRSLIKVKDVAKKLDYLKLKKDLEVQLDEISYYKDNQLTLLVAGSQGQEESAMARIVNGEHPEVRLTPDDTVIFSAEPIPGNEVSVYELIDTIAKNGIRVLYTALSRDFHVSGHASCDELGQMIKRTSPQKLLPIGGAFRQMAAYRSLAEKLGYKRNNILLLEDGQEVIFTKDGVRFGRMIPVKNVYVDEISGEEVESFVLRDRQKLSEGGIVIVLAEIDSATGQIVGAPDLIVRGFRADDKKILRTLLRQDLKVLAAKKGRVTNWVYIRKLIGEIAERRIFRQLRRRPLVLPVVIEA